MTNIIMVNPYSSIFIHLRADKAALMIYTSVIKVGMKIMTRMVNVHC